MRKYLFLLFTLLIHDFTFAQTRDTIRFENVVGLIIIPVLIDGKVHNFLFDTGGECTVIREDVVAKLDKTNCSKEELNDAFNKVTIQSKCTVKSFSIGTSDLNNLSIVSFPNSALFNCMGVEGIIGVDVIQQFDWLIDFNNHYIIKIDTSYIVKGLNDYVAIDFYKNKLRPRIKLKIGNKIVDFLFDSGANESLIHKKSYKKIKNQIIKSYNQVSSISGVNSTDKLSKELVFLVNTQPNNLNLKKYDVSFSTVSNGENRIGNAFWGHNQIFFSWTKNKLLFKPVDTEKKKAYGITLKMINDTMTVNTLIYTEQILISGLKIGDKVKTIDGKSFKNYCELLTYQLLTHNDILTIELQNGKQVTLKKENIF